MTNTINQFFTHDHHRLDDLFIQFQKAEKHELQLELFQQFQEGLTAHIEWEEQLLFPQIEQAAGFPPHGGPTHVMRMEHQQIKECLSNIEQAITQMQESKGSQQQLLNILSEHNIKEENILYPLCDRLLADITKSEILDNIEPAKQLSA